MLKSVDFESVLCLIDTTIAPSYLSTTQEIILKETWNGKTYTEIAAQYNYDAEYIKTVGCNLWQNLSQAFSEQINKSNFVPLIRQKTTKYIEHIEQKKSQIHFSDNSSDSAKVDLEKHTYWATAPYIRNFLGREEELGTLKSWSVDSDCQCIVVSGMVGCGKSSLLAEFAQKNQKQFDCIIWSSLLQKPSLETLLTNYLRITDKNSANSFDPTSLELSILLPELIERLKQQKVLLIVDGLECILNINRVNTTYKRSFEEYTQFLRAIITTKHQSLLMASSLIKPTMLEYHPLNQVNFLDLQGFDTPTTKLALSREDSNSDISCLTEQTILFLSKILHGNPLLLQITKNCLSNLCTEDVEEILQDLSHTEAIISLLERELKYLSDLNREIIYWLAISSAPLSLAKLSQNIEISSRRVEILQSIKTLVNRSLVSQQGDAYLLMPLMKYFLRRKLVRTTLQFDEN